jgi:hypothetical protein
VSEETTNRYFDELASGLALQQATGILGVGS